MHEHVATWEVCAAQLPSRDSLLEEEIFGTIFTESIGDSLKLPYGVALSALLTKEDLTRQALTLRLQQKPSSQNETNSVSFPCKESLNVASSRGDKADKRRSKIKLSAGTATRRVTTRVTATFESARKPTRRVWRDPTTVVVDVSSKTPRRLWLPLFPIVRPNRTMRCRLGKPPTWTQVRLHTW